MQYNNIGHSIIVLITIFLFSSCNSLNGDLKIFFRELEIEFENTEALEYIKTCPPDSLRDLLPIFNLEVKNVTHKEKRFEKWQEKIQDHLKEVNPEFREEVLIHAFQNFLKGDFIEVQEIEESVAKMRE